MSHKTPKHARATKVAALVPLAALSAAWTVNVLVTGSDSATASGQVAPATSGMVGLLPDGTRLPPATVLKHPASVGAPATDISQAHATSIVASADTSGIPAAALAAYQRAATVIDEAAPSCHLSWELLGAIGRVESDHGRADGNTLTDTGISTPGVFGPVLNGKDGTQRVRDTDGGVLDHDSVDDRAVGPMQFLPSTWYSVAVDADGDGVRNPQDINDAALAAAVYLCSGGADLGTLAGEKQAVYRYNHSSSYVSTVLGVMKAYDAGDYTSVPNSTMIPAASFAPAPQHHATHGPGDSGPTAPSSSTAVVAGGAPQHHVSAKPSRTGSAKPTASPSSDPVTKLTKPVQDVLASTAQLLQVCVTALVQDGIKDPTTAVPQALTECVNQLTGDTLPQAQQDVTGVLTGLTDLLQSLLGGVLGGLLGGGK